MEMARLQLLLSLLLSMTVTTCGGIATSPSPGVTLAPTQRSTATVQPSPPPAPEAIPGGVMTLTLASEGEFIVTGEMEGTTGLAYFLDSAGWLYVFDGASLGVVAKEQVLSSLQEGKLYDLAVDGKMGRVYVADGAREETLILDAETLSPLGRIDAYGRITVDPVTHRLYIARVGVYVADGERGEIIDQIEETIPEEGMEIYSGVPRGVNVYINPGNRHLYIMMDNNTPGSNSRHWLDLYDADDHTLLAERVPLPYGSSGAPGFDLERGLDYVSGYHPITGHRKLVALDAEGREVDHLWGVGGDVFFSPRRHLIYVAGWEGLDVIEAQTMNYLDSYPLTVTLHDPRHGRFYSLG
ncbi:MAG: YncE family protein [Anaerolineae bacterium]